MMIIRLFFIRRNLKKSQHNAIVSCYEENDKGHGRVERRLCYVSDQAGLVRATR